MQSHRKLIIVMSAVLGLTACYPERPWIRVWGGDKETQTPRKSTPRERAEEQPTIVTGAEGDIPSNNSNVISTEPVPGMPDTAPAVVTPADPTPAPTPQAPAVTADAMPSSADAGTNMNAPADVNAGDAAAGAAGAAGPASTPDGKVLTLQADAAFAFGQSELTPEGMKKLDELAGRLANMDKASLTNVTVIGHADRLGPPGLNQVLSERRALAVKTYLVDQGIDPTIVQTEGRGASEPAVSCPGSKASPKLKSCLAPNRRVEVLVNANR